MKGVLGRHHTSYVTAISEFYSDSNKIKIFPIHCDSKQMLMYNLNQSIHTHIITVYLLKINRIWKDHVALFSLRKVNNDPY